LGVVDAVIAFAVFAGVVVVVVVVSVDADGG
jgi:hypothetical protein